MNIKQNTKIILNNLKIIKYYDNQLVAHGLKGPKKVVSLPLVLDEKLSCFVGMMLGDGHLKKGVCRIEFEVADESFSNLFSDLVKEKFNTKVIIREVIDKRPNRKKRYNAHMNSGPVYWFLNKVFEIPIGKKSHIIQVPLLIKKSNKKLKSAFVIGVLLAEGGKRQSGYGLSTASKVFRGGIVNLLKELDISCRSDEWEYKKYKKRYYGLCFRRKEIVKLVRGCRSGQTGQIFQEFSKKFLLKA